MEWSQLMEIPSEIEAEIVHGALESAGIPCEIESLKFHAEPVNFGPLSRVRIHVPADRLEDARRVLAELEAAAPADTDDVGGSY